jgi:uncharacterized cupredoxin-like copper-binding protein
MFAMRKSHLAALVVALALTGCAGAKDAVVPEGGAARAESARLAAVDWSGAQVVTVSLSEFAFAPDALTFRRGAPYRLRLRNDGDVTHYFVSEGFFGAIAVEKLQTPEGDIARPEVASIALAPGAEKELWFVPLDAGAYELECTAPLHSAFGMVGRIRIT